MTVFDEKRAIAERGDITRFKKLFKKLEDGKNVTICFIGGSITQGSLSSSPQTCYAYRVYVWLKEKFKSAQVKYVNAGIGGTTSAFGAARVDADVLSHKPDMVLVEFSVNDECNDYFYESYEGLIRRLLYDSSKPAVAALFNFYYENGKSAERLHSRVARHYGIPAASMHGAIYDDILSGEISDINILSPDGLHPNDTGHELLSNVVINLLKALYEEYKNGTNSENMFEEKKEPLTYNRFESAIRLDNRNFHAELSGFIEDTTPQKAVSDCFKNGWLGTKKNDKIVFELRDSYECSGIAIQYCKTIERPAPVAEVVIDGKTDEAVLIDAAFDESWGNLLDLKQLFLHVEKSFHRLEIRIVDDSDGRAVPFNLVSVIIMK